MRRSAAGVLVAVWVAVALRAVSLYGGSAMDDFFITYRYADNLAAGDGFVFNPGERVFGLTEPAWGFLLGVARALLPAPVPWIAATGTALGLLGLAFVLWRETRMRDREAEALAGGTLLVTLAVFWSNRGAGVIPGLALLALAVHLRRRPILAGILGGLAVGLRPELILGLLLAAGFVYLEERRWPWRVAGAAAATIAAGALACRLWFGTFLPITFGAKQSFASWDPVARESAAHFWPAYLPILHRVWGPAWWLFFALAAAGCALLLRNRSRAGPALRTIVAFGVALFPIYPLLGVPFFEWYALPTLVAALYGFAWLAIECGRAVADSWQRRGGTAPRWLAAALAGAILLLATPPLRTLAWALRHAVTSQHFLSYRDAGLWIRDRSATNARIAALEVGTLAWASDRHVVDLLGLVSPEALENVAARRVIDTLHADPTDYFVLTEGLEGLIGPVRTLPWFADRYELVHTLQAIGNQEMWIFRRR